MGGSFYKINCEEASWSSGLELEQGNLAHRPAVKEVIFRFLRSTLCKI